MIKNFTDERNAYWSTDFLSLRFSLFQLGDWIMSLTCLYQIPFLLIHINLVIGSDKMCFGKTIEIPVSGRPVSLGSLYSAQDKVFINSARICFTKHTRTISSSNFFFLPTLFVIFVDL